MEPQKRRPRRRGSKYETPKQGAQILIRRIHQILMPFERCHLVRSESLRAVCLRMAPWETRLGILDVQDLGTDAVISRRTRRSMTRRTRRSPVWVLKGSRRALGNSNRRTRRRRLRAYTESHGDKQAVHHPDVATRASLNRVALAMSTMVVHRHRHRARWSQRATFRKP